MFIVWSPMGILFDFLYMYFVYYVWVCVHVCSQAEAYALIVKYSQKKWTIFGEELIFNLNVGFIDKNKKLWLQLISPN